jgi:anti-sigma-K factor RskA
LNRKVPMNQKLQNENELSVRYILNELDPSEETMMEQAMMEDQNLLIEVESMRRTLRKCGDLPCYSAPEQVLGHVMDEVASYQAAKSSVVRLRTFRNFSYAAAATVLLAGGTAWYVQGSFAGVAKSGSTLVTETPVNMDIQHPVRTPWEDKRDIIHLSSVGASVSLLPDSSTSRLRPIEDSSAGRVSVRQIQLTGSQN